MAPLTWPSLAPLGYVTEDIPSSATSANAFCLEPESKTTIYILIDTTTKFPRILDPCARFW